MDVQPIINELCSGSIAGTCIVRIRDIWEFLGIAASICGAVVVAIWFAIRWVYAAVLRHKDAEIASLKTLLNGYKDKLDGATPEEAQARIAELERAVRALKPRSLTREQMTAIKERLQQTLPEIQVAVALARDSSASDGYSYMTQFNDILSSVPRVHRSAIEAVMGDNPPTPNGLAIQINSQHIDGSRAIAEIFGEAFKTAEVPFDYGYFDGAKGAHIRIFLFPNQQFPDQRPFDTLNKSIAAT